MGSDEISKNNDRDFSKIMQASTSHRLASRENIAQLAFDIINYVNAHWFSGPPFHIHGHYQLDQIQPEQIALIPNNAMFRSILKYGEMI